MRGRPTWGRELGGGREGGGAGSLSARKKKKQKFSPDFPAAEPRFGARAGFPARQAALTFGGAWNPLPVLGESPACTFPSPAGVLHGERALFAA